MLLSTGELTAAVFAPLLQAREDAVHVVQLPGRLLALPQQQVFFHRQQLEDAPVLRHQTNATPGDRIGFNALHGFSAKAHDALRGRHHAHDAFQRGGFAGAVATQQGDQFAIVHLQGDALQHVAFAVVGMYIFQFQNHALPPVIMLPR
ncbi:MAG: hypothetical protein ACD_23C01236G0003 [uncultured bacterium]|nr:MAG: hypothetical protein ACD_23C01236G0003 [uncultured bacterium]